MNKKLAAGIFLIVIAILCIFFIVWARKPSVGNISKNQNTTPENTGTTQPERIDTAYFTVALPTGFTVKTNEENASGPNLVQIVATKPLANGQQIAITVGPLPKDGLVGIASYNLRIKSPETYTKLEFGGMPAGVPTFFSATNAIYEITSFWPHAGLYAGITVSGIPAQKSDINQALAITLANWEWR